MTLILAGQALEDMSALSEATQTGLGLIDGGEAWLDWAISSPSARYQFADESALLEGVQSGLHGSRLMLLPGLGLLIGPVALLALGASGVRTLAKGEAAGKVTPSVAKLLSEANLLTVRELEAARAWLNQQGVADRPLFQALSLPDRIAMARQAGDDAETGDLAQPASAFAVALARTPAEFLDYRRLYLAVAGRAPQATDAQRQQLAEQCVQGLRQALFGALDCPSFDGLPGPADVNEAVRTWLSSGRQLGFASLAAGARQICERTAFVVAPSAAAAQAAVARYLASAGAAAGSGTLAGRLQQDGRSVRFQVGGADLVLGANGVLALDDFTDQAETG